jgi:amino acid transporter
MNTTNDKTNILPELKKPNIFYPFIALIIFLIICLFCLLFKVTNPFNSKENKSQEEIIADIFIVLFFSLLVFGICVILLPNFKEVRKKSF